MLPQCQKDTCERQALYWSQFMHQWFIRFPEFTECNKTSSPFRKNSNVSFGTSMSILVSYMINCGRNPFLRDPFRLWRNQNNLIREIAGDIVALMLTLSMNGPLRYLYAEWKWKRPHFCESLRWKSTLIFAKGIAFANAFDWCEQVFRQHVKWISSSI